MDHVFEDRVVVEIILHLLGDGDDDSDDEEEETDDTNDTSKEQVGDGKPKTIYQKLEKIKKGYAGKVFSRHTDGPLNLVGQRTSSCPTRSRKRSSYARR